MASPRYLGTVRCNCLLGVNTMDLVELPYPLFESVSGILGLQNIMIEEPDPRIVLAHVSAFPNVEAELIAHTVSSNSY